MPKLSQEQIAAAKQQNAERGISDEPKVLKPLPCGNGEAYVYKLVACTSGLAKSSQRPQWTWELTLDGRYHPELVGTGYLEKIWHYTPADTGNEWGITKMFHAFGYDPSSDTDELINEEATVLVYPVVETYQGKPKMRARRFAYHDETEFPQAQGSEPPFGGENDPYTPQDAPADAYQVPADDPWAKGPEVPAQAAPVAPPVPETSEEDTW